MPPDLSLHQPPAKQPGPPTPPCNGAAPTPASEQTPPWVAELLGLLRRQEQMLTLANALLRNASKRELRRETISGSEAADVLGLGLRTWRTMDSAGLVPKPVRLGGRVVWRTAEIRAWLAAGAPDRQSWEQTKEERRRAKARGRR